MKRNLIIASMVFLAIILAQVSFVSASESLLVPGGCCVMVGCCIDQGGQCSYDQTCTYWDMTGWDNGAQFCSYVKLWGYANETKWFDYTCESILLNTADPLLDGQFPEVCKNGWDIPEFSSVAAGIAIAGAIAGFVFLRKKSERK